MDRNELNKLKNVALSNTQIMQAINGQANLVLYPDIHKYLTLDKLLGSSGACILLYESRPSYGHWCCVFKLNNNDIEFFNSYGDIKEYEGYPDEMIDYIPEPFRIASNQNHKYLSKLMIESKYSLSYNQYKFQSMGKGIRTCGRHVACRLNMRNYSLDNYHKTIKKWCNDLKVDSDDVVTIWTQNIK